jgi:tetratricopeptide (TPR) repeat protein
MEAKEALFKVKLIGLCTASFPIKRGVKISNISKDGLDFERNGQKLYSCSYASIKPRIRDGGTLARPRYQVDLGDECKIFAETNDLEAAQTFSDILYTFHRSAEDWFRAQSAFPKIAQDYRDMSVKPAFPEDARKFKVQAEHAIREKRFKDAVDKYEDALKIAPWWSEGHFNRALVLAELQQFQEAVLEMQKYLLLVPDAPDARSAQDKIYEWGGDVPNYAPLARTAEEIPQFAGIGTVLALENEIPIVRTIIESGPAYKAGIKVGDKIIKVNGNTTKGMEFQSLVNQIRGAKGSPVVLTIMREGWREAKEVTIVRDIIRSDSSRP